LGSAECGQRPPPDAADEKWFKLRLVQQEGIRLLGGLNNPCLTVPLVTFQRFFLAGET
jgi:hypothetical protein